MLEKGFPFHIEELITIEKDLRLKEGEWVGESLSDERNFFTPTTLKEDLK